MRIFYKSLILAVALAFSFTISWVCKPYIRDHDINDFHLTDYLPSFLFVIIMFLIFDLYHSIRHKLFNKVAVLTIIFVAASIYEILKLFTREFDIYNIIAIVLGSVTVSLFICPFKK